VKRVHDDMRQFRSDSRNALEQRVWIDTPPHLFQ
jgi:hypothetical protein